MTGKESFLNASDEQIEKILRSEAAWHKHEIAQLKRQRELIFCSPHLWIGVVIVATLIVILGYYYEWDWRKVIDKIIEWGGITFVTSVATAFVIKKINSVKNTVSEK